MARPGEDHPYAKLTADAVREIRSTCGHTQQLADRYGVNRSAIRAVRIGQTWRHVQ